MPDREKVTKALEKALAASKAVDSGFIWITVGEGQKALEMLKEQEPMQMKVYEDYGSIKFGYCPKCTLFINNRSYPKSCGCGQAVKWDD